MPTVSGIHRAALSVTDRCDIAVEFYLSQRPSGTHEAAGAHAPVEAAVATE